MSRNNDSGLGCLLWGVLIVGLLLQENLFRSSSGIGFWMCYLVIAAVCLYAVYLVSSLVQSRLTAWELEHTLCKHGIKGGETLGICSVCQTDKLQDEERHRAERAQCERRNAIKQSADELRISEHRRLTRQRLHRLDYLLKLSPVQFEEACAQLFQVLQYEAKLTPKSNDAGVDIRLQKDGKSYVVQCKRFRRENLVGRPDLQKFLGVIVSGQHDGGYFVTTSDFSSQAIAFAKSNAIHLIDGNELVRLMIEAFGEQELLEYRALCKECGEVVKFNLHTPAQVICPNNHSVFNDFDSSWFLVASEDGVPACKKCGKPMRLVSGRYGKFWGCTGYPSCLFTINMPENSYRKQKRSGGTGQTE